MNKREWLISKGLAKAGRGKFSNAAKDALAKAEANGMVFDDAPAKPAPKVKAVVKDTPKESVSDSPITEIMFANEMPNYGREWFVRNGKRKVSIGPATVCGNCRYSLIGHTCNDPVILYRGEFVKVEG